MDSRADSAHAVPGSRWAWRTDVLNDPLVFGLTSSSTADVSIQHVPHVDWNSMPIP